MSSSKIDDCSAAACVEPTGCSPTRLAGESVNESLLRSMQRRHLEGPTHRATVYEPQVRISRRPTAKEAIVFRVFGPPNRKHWSTIRTHCAIGATVELVFHTINKQRW